MAWDSLKILAVVPARGGSKGIPRKNLSQVGGISLIGHAAKVATALHWIDHAVISTDDLDMLEEGKRWGLEAPFLRPQELAQDLTSAVDTWCHAWLSCEDYYHCRFDLSIWLQPTTPLRTPEEVEMTVRALVEGNHQAAATVSLVPGHFTPQKILTLNKEGVLQYFDQAGPNHTARQTIPSYYYRNGLCYAVTRSTLLDKRSIIEEDCVGVIINRPLVNIDEPIELAFARFMHQSSLNPISN